MPSFSPSLEETLQRALKEALTRNHAYSTIEHLLLALLEDPDASKVMKACGVDLPQLKEAVTGYVDNELTELNVARLRRKRNKTDEEKETLEEFKKTGPVPTSGFQRVVQRAILHVQSSDREQVNGANVLVALFSERDSYAVFFLQQQDMSRLDAVTYISHGVGRGEILETQPEDDKQARLVINRVFRDDLKPLSDSVPAQPVLNTPRVADKVVELVLDITAQAALSSPNSHELRRPLLTLGIFGPWGSGKTTLLRCIGDKARKAGFVPVFINTWKWDGEEEIFAFVNRELLRSLSGVRGLRSRAVAIRLLIKIKSNYRRWLAWVLLLSLSIYAVLFIDWQKTITTGTVDKNSLIAIIIAVVVAIVAKPIGTMVERLVLQEPIDVDARQSLSISYRYLHFLRRLAYSKKNAPLMFLFDDLDRCSDERVVSFVKSIHSLTSEGSVCVVACDEDFTEAAIYAQFKSVAEFLREGREFGRRFLEKIIQVPFRLPEVSSDDLRALGLVPVTTSPNDGDQTVSSSVIDDGHRAREVHSPTKDTKPSDPGQLDEAKLSEISGNILSLVAEAQGLEIRQAKSLANLIKLYSMIFPPVDEAAAQRLAAFLVVDYVDEHWIPEKYFGASRPSVRSGLDRVENELRIRLGSDPAALYRLYRLFGFRLPREVWPSHLNDDDQVSA